MRGFLENEEGDFFAWLKKLTVARLEKMTADDLNVSAQWGACELRVRVSPASPTPVTRRLRA